MDPQATAGRIVHYHAASDVAFKPRAAIVNIDTKEDGLAELTLFTRIGPLVYTSVKYSEEPKAGCWSWMPYQKKKAQAPEGNVSESAEPRPDISGPAKSTEPPTTQSGAVPEAPEARSPGFHPDDRMGDPEVLAPTANPDRGTERAP